MLSGRCRFLNEEGPEIAVRSRKGCSMLFFGLAKTAKRSQAEMHVTGRVFLLAVLFVAMCEAAIAEPKRVLLLNSFGRDFGSYGAFAREFRAELDRKSPETLEFFE